jgi:hypothetical protein
VSADGAISIQLAALRSVGQSDMADDPEPPAFTRRFKIVRLLTQSSDVFMPSVSI